jgi:hypothetical protein
MAELSGAKVTARTAAKFNRQRHIVAFVQGVFHRAFRRENIAPVQTTNPVALLSGEYKAKRGGREAVHVVDPGLKVALLIVVSCAPLLGQASSTKAQSATFHIEGTISSPWESLLPGTLVPRKKLIFHGEQPITTLASDEKDSYLAIPRTEVTFQSGHESKTVVVDDKGFYSADLPFGVYTMIAQGPTIWPQALTPYSRLFRVASPTTVILNGTLYMARTDCDALVGGDSEEQKNEQWKDACGGNDSFLVPSKDGSPLQLYIQYPRRQTTDRGYLYTSNKIAEPDVPVVVAYNLFSLEANAIFYDLKDRTIAATGNVVTEDGSGKTEHADSIRFRIENGGAVPLPSE